MQPEYAINIPGTHDAYDVSIFKTVIIAPHDPFSYMEMADFIVDRENATGVEGMSKTDCWIPVPDHKQPEIGVAQSPHRSLAAVPGITVRLVLRPPQLRSSLKTGKIEATTQVKVELISVVRELMLQIVKNSLC